MDKIIGSGHSLGGASIIGVGEADDRVKLVLSLDPHGNTLKDTIGNYSKLHEKYLQVQNTEQMYTVEPRNLPIHGPGIYDKMKDENKFEAFILENCDHMHQGDLMAIMGLELDNMMCDAKFKEDRCMFDPRKRELMLYFTHL